MGSTHIAGGCLAGAALTPVTSDLLGLGFTPAALAAGVGIAAVAGMLADCDTKDSLISHGVLPGRGLLGRFSRALGWYLSIPPRLLGRSTRGVLGHRGGTHSVSFMIGWALLAAPVYALMTLSFAFIISLVLSAFSVVLPFVPTLPLGIFASWLWGHMGEIMPLTIVAVFWGYFAHLFLDSLTQAPVPWLWPFSKKRFFLLPKQLRVKTGSHLEYKFVRPTIIVLFVAATAITIVIPLGREVYHKTQTIEQSAPPPSHSASSRVGRMDGR